MLSDLSIIGFRVGHSHVQTITQLIIKITISSIVIGLKNSHFPLIHLQVVIGQFVIGQFNKTITSKVVVTCVRACVRFCDFGA